MSVQMRTSDFHHSNGAWVVPCPCLERHTAQGAPQGAAPLTPPARLPPFPVYPLVLRLHPAPLLAVPSPGAGLCGPVSPMAFCCPPQDELGDLGASTGPLPTPAGWIQTSAHLPHFPGPGHWGRGFTVSCTPFAVDPAPLLGHLGYDLPVSPCTGIWACRSCWSSSILWKWLIQCHLPQARSPALPADGFCPPQTC